MAVVASHLPSSPFSLSVRNHLVERKKHSLKARDATRRVTTLCFVLVLVMVCGGGRSRSSFSFPDSLHVEKEGEKTSLHSSDSRRDASRGSIHPGRVRRSDLFFRLLDASRCVRWWRRRGVSTGGRPAQIILLLFAFAVVVGLVATSRRVEVVLVVLESTRSLFNNRK